MYNFDNEIGYKVINSYMDVDNYPMTVKISQIKRLTSLGYWRVFNHVRYFF